MNSIENGREHERLPEEPAQRDDVGNQPQGTAPHVFARLPASGVPDDVARHWAVADSRAARQLTDQVARRDALVLMARNMHASQTYAHALHQRAPKLAMEAAWLVDRDLPQREAAPSGDQPGRPAAGDMAPPAIDLSKKSVDLSNKDVDQGPDAAFEPPERLRKRYLIAGQKYYFRHASNELAFEDKDRSLVTKHNDPDVAVSMVELAEAKGWRTIKIKGTTEFKREAWLAAALRGIEVTGYQPDKLDLARFDEQRASDLPRPANEILKAPERPRDEASRKPEEKPTAQSPQHATGTTSQDKDRLPRGKEVQALLRGEQPATPSAPSEYGSERPARPLLAQQQVAVDVLKSILRARGDSEEAVGMAARLAAERFQHPRVYVGRLTDHGKARYEFNPNSEPSYFLKLETPAGERVVWGADLPRALKEGNAELGQEIALSYQGMKNVTVWCKERDELGEETGKMIEIDAERNTWDICRLDRLQFEAKNFLLASARQSDKVSHMTPVVNVYDYAAPRQPQRETAPAPERGNDARRPDRQPAR